MEKSPAVEDASSEEPVQQEDSVKEIIEVNNEGKENFTQMETSEEDQEASDQKEVEFDITEHENLDALYSFNEEESEDIPQGKDDEVKIEKEIKDELKSSDEFQEKEVKNRSVIDRETDQNETFNNKIKLKDLEEEFSNEKPVKKMRDRDIFLYLSDKEIERIVGNVFNDDRDDFASTMERITESDSYEEATEILKSVFKSYNVNPYAKDAITFTNSVSNYFEQT